MTGFALPVETAPMEARAADALPDGDGWQFEPKWDGFRCLAYKAGSAVELMSKSGKSLARYFPEVVATVAAMKADSFVMDGELIIEVEGALAFDALQARLHPAASRIAKLSRETPAQLVAFDCLAAGGRALLDEPLPVRREALTNVVAGSPVLLSPVIGDAAAATHLLDSPSAAIDGIIAKRLDEPYRVGERAMLKVKRHRTADCVVGGFRYASGNNEIGSLLLGLYDAAGRLDHIGFVSGLPPAIRNGLKAKLETLIEPPGFTGKAPGGPSRWSTERSAEWQPLRPELVVEVQYDQVTADRLRHAAGFIRWRPDKAPRQCSFDQLALPAGPEQVASWIAGADPKR